MSYSLEVYLIYTRIGTFGPGKGGGNLPVWFVGGWGTGGNN